MLRTIKGYGIDREFLEKTEPGDELLFRWYTAIKTIQEKERELDQIMGELKSG